MANGLITDPKTKKNSDIYNTAVERFQRAETDDGDNRKSALEDLKFTYNEGDGQWPDNSKGERAAQGRPSVTLNNVVKIVRANLGELHLSPPTIKVRPVDDAADIITAAILTEFLRIIQNESNADAARSNACKYAWAASAGYYRVDIQYAGGLTFDQEIKINSIDNPFSVIFDPTAIKANKSDARYCFVTEKITKKEYEEEYGNSEASSFSADDKSWLNDDEVRIAEYFYVEHETFNLARVITPDSVSETEDRTPGETYVEIKELVLEEHKKYIVDERKTKIPKIMWCKIAGNKIIEGPKQIPGTIIPILRVVGEEICIEGKMVRRSMIRDAKDPQKMVNYFITMATETIAQAPKAPYVSADVCTKGYKDDWENAHLNPKGVLLYTFKPGVPTPERTLPPQIPQAALSMINLGLEGIENTTGQYGASFGAPTSDRSGVMLDKRQAASSRSAYPFFESLKDTMQLEGRLLLQLIPKVYSIKRILDILGDSVREKYLLGGLILKDENGEPILDENGEPKSLDLNIGTYDTSIETGPGAATKRAEAYAQIVQIMQYAPDAAGVLLPFATKFADWPGADELTKALTGAGASDKPAEANNQPTTG